MPNTPAPGASNRVRVEEGFALDVVAPLRSLLGIAENVRPLARREGVAVVLILDDYVGRPSAHLGDDAHAPTAGDCVQYALFMSNLRPPAERQLIDRAQG